MRSILDHELAPVPLSLASIDSKLNKCNKADLADITTEGLDVIKEIPNFHQKTCVIIDGPALIQSIGRPDSSLTFGDLADVFSASVMKNFSTCCIRVDVLFDRYKELSIKSSTREQRARNSRPIRCVIHNREVKLPYSWKQFISLPSNKENLASFLSQELREVSRNMSPDSELIIAGGFDDITETYTTMNREDRHINHLRADHEEADTRIVLHVNDALKQGYDRIIIQCRDTDVLVMMVSLLHNSSSEIWMKAGTIKKPRNIAIHKISTLTKEIRDNLCSFHAITGCDSTSQFSGKGKRSAWKVYAKHPELFSGMGTKKLSDKTFNDIERFVSILYSGDKDVRDINEVRYNLFVKNKSIEALPPTRDALQLHAERANFQCYVWKRATYPIQDLPDPTKSGWINDGNVLKPILMTIESVPECCHQLITCQCRHGCTLRCGCANHNMPCILSCHCGGDCRNQANYTIDENN